MGKFSQTSFLEKDGFDSNLNMEDIRNSDYIMGKGSKEILT